MGGARETVRFDARKPNPRGPVARRAPQSHNWSAPLW